jgi:MFS transporter, FHS family, glucose/mannose:H+ symporter
MTIRSLHFAAACVGMLLFGMAMVSLGTINSFLSVRLSLDAMTLGALAAVLPLGILAGSLIFGPLVDRFGYRFPFGGAALLLGGGFLCTAFAGSLAILQASFFAIGLGGGVLNGGTNALVADISETNKGSRLSLLGVFFGIGALGMPALTASLMNFVPLANIVSGIGLTILVPGIAFLLLRFPAPKQVQGFPLSQGASLLRDPKLLLLASLLFFQSGLEGMVNNWTVLYLERGISAETGAALFSLTFYAVSLTVARLFLGGILRRVAGTRVMAWCVGIGLVGALILVWAGSLGVALAGIALLGVGFAPVFPVVLGLVGELHPRLTGTAFGIALVIALLGNTILNYALGMISQSAGLSAYPLALVACIILQGVLFIIVTKKRT